MKALIIPKKRIGKKISFIFLFFFFCTITYEQTYISNSHNFESYPYNSGYVKETCKIIIDGENFKLELSDGSVIESTIRFTKESDYKGIHYREFKLANKGFGKVSEEDMYLNLKAVNDFWYHFYFKIDEAKKYNINKISTCNDTIKTFRNSCWGDNIDEVKNNESVEEYETNMDDVLAYKSEIANKDVLIVYVFVNNKLVRAKYIFVEKHSNRNDYISDYKELDRLLNKKYGIPEDSDVIWKNDLYQDDYSDWGLAISIGHLVYYSEYFDNGTKIYHVVKGENYEISHVIEYTSLEFENLEQEKKESKAIDEL